MKKKSTPLMGALHPLLFFVFVYGLSLFMAIFVCRMVYYCVNKEDAKSSAKVVQGNLNSTVFADNLSHQEYK